MNSSNLVSLAGIFIFLAVAWLCSSDRRRVNGRLLVVGLGLQFLFGALLFLTPWGRDVFLGVNAAVNAVLAPAGKGAEFVFGPLATGKLVTDTEPGQASLGFILAFQSLPTIIYFSALMAILQHFGVLQLLVKAFAFVFTRLMRLSGAESLCAASNIFVGVESATTVKGHLARMTRSELCTVLTAGMATIAGSVLGLYTSILGEALPEIAGHLVSASLLSAPAALVMSKLVLPEGETPETLGLSVAPHYEREPSFFAAVIAGAQTGLQLILGVVTLLIAVLGLVALANGLLGALQEGWSLESGLGWCFRWCAYAMGVPGEDAALVGEILGERPIQTEVASYFHLKAALAEGLIQHPRSAVILAYALCGFAHLPSVAIFVGGVAAIVPERRADLAAVAWRALLAATLACFLTACVAGLFYTDALANSMVIGTPAP